MGSLNANTYGRDELKHYRGWRINIVGKFMGLTRTPSGWVSLILENPKIGNKIIDSHIWCNFNYKAKLDFIKGMK
jgi:hypothetical protein